MTTGGTVSMVKWEVVFRELDEALKSVESKYTPKSQMNILIVVSNKELCQFKAPFAEVRSRVWELSAEYPHMAALIISTIRNTTIYEVVRYPLIEGRGVGAAGDSHTLETFEHLDGHERDLVVRLLCSQIQDRYVIDDINDAK